MFLPFASPAPGTVQTIWLMLTRTRTHHLTQGHLRVSISSKSTYTAGTGHQIPVTPWECSLGLSALFADYLHGRNCLAQGHTFLTQCQIMPPALSHRLETALKGIPASEQPIPASEQPLSGLSCFLPLCSTLLQSPPFPRVSQSQVPGDPICSTDEDPQRVPGSCLAEMPIKLKQTRS